MPLDIPAQILTAYNFLKDIVVSVIGTILGFGTAALTRILFIIIITVAIYKFAAKKLLPSSGLAFTVSVIVAILAANALPESIASALLVPWFALGIAVLILSFTLLFKLPWWIRRGILLLLTLVFGILWWNYTKNPLHLAAAIVSFLFFMFDPYIHSFIVTLRKGEEEGKEIGVEIKILEKRIEDATGAGASKEEINSLQKELKELIKKA